MAQGALQTKVLISTYEKLNLMKSGDKITCDLTWIIGPKFEKEVFGCPFNKSFYVSMVDEAWKEQKEIYNSN